MRCLVTLAPAGVEPYATGVRGLAETARLLGWRLLVLGDDDLRGERPWQAKRFAIRRAYAQGADRVVWCDADVVVHRPQALAEFIGREGREGIWAQYRLGLSCYWSAQEARNVAAFGGEGRQRAHRARELYECLLRGFDLDAAEFFGDWIVVWNVPPEVGLSLLETWDRVAEYLQADELTWSDGVSLGLAAAAHRVPIRYLLPKRQMARVITHLLYSNKNNLYRTKGVCLP